MLHRKRTGEIIAAGERVPNPYGEGQLVISKWRHVPIYKGNRRKPIRYDVEVIAFKPLDQRHSGEIAYTEFAPYELQLEWRDQA